jgi:hypothetical protein
MLLLVKIFVTVVVILLLAAVAEFSSSRLAGVLAGYPIGTAIVLYFYGLEQGVDFASASATYNLVGMVPTLVFACCYLAVLRKAPDCTPLIPSITALGGYLATGLFLGQFRFGQEAAFCITVVAILLAGHLARSKGETPTVPRLPYTVGLLCFRAIMAACLVVLITSLAGGVGPRWAGLLSAFPLALYPLLLMIHLQYGSAQASAILGSFPSGLWSVLSYSLTVAHAYPAYGLFRGTLCGFAVATACLLLFNIKTFYSLGLQLAGAPQGRRS